MQLLRKSVRDSLARLLLAIVERCIERCMYATSSNNVAEKMTNDAATILSADNCGDLVARDDGAGRRWARVLPTP
jgi:hypothetical protein